MTSEQSLKTHFHAASRNHGDQNIHVCWRRKMKVMEAPCDARIPVRQTGECVAQRYKFHRPPADHHHPRHILNTGFVSAFVSPDLALRLRGPGSRTPPVPWWSPEWSHLTSSMRFPQKPPRLHRRLEWRHTDSKLTTANQVRVKTQRDITRKL